MFWIFKIAIQISKIVDIDGILNKDKTFLNLIKKLEPIYKNIKHVKSLKNF